MAARSIGSGTISFGLVSIPVKLFTAASSESVSFNRLHKEHQGKPCLSRINQVLVCRAHEPEVQIAHADTVSGFEHVKDAYVVFTDEELKSIEATRKNELTLLEFVPAQTVDFLYIEKTYFLGPDKGGADSYRLLSETMKDEGRIAVGTFARGGKDTLVLVRPYRDGLILHEAYYANEVRDFDDVPKGEPRQLSERERELARIVLRQLARTAFDPSRFKDEWAAKVAKLVEQKLAGEELTFAPRKSGTVIDLVEALKQSITDLKGKRDAALAEAAPVAARPKGPKKAAPRPKAEAKKRRSTDAV